jgi:hypothetical protein
LKKVFDLLVALGWIKIKKGTYQGQVRTRLWPDQKLIDYLESAITYPPVKAHDEEFILLKQRIKNTKSKHYIEFNDSDHSAISQMRVDLDLINAVAGKHRLSLDIKNTVVSKDFLDFIHFNRIVNELSISEYECHYQILRACIDDTYLQLAKNENYRFKYDSHNIKETKSNPTVNSLTVIPLFRGLGLSNDDYTKYYNADVLYSAVNQTIKLLVTKGGEDFYYLNKL